MLGYYYPSETLLVTISKDCTVTEGEVTFTRASTFTRKLCPRETVRASACVRVKWKPCFSASEIYPAPQSANVTAEEATRPQRRGRIREDSTDLIYILLLLF